MMCVVGRCDKDLDGRITGEEVKEVIMLSASANKLSKLKEQAAEYAALIMEELDVDRTGFIEVLVYSICLVMKFPVDCILFQCSQSNLSSPDGSQCAKLIGDGYGWGHAVESVGNIDARLCGRIRQGCHPAVQPVADPPIQGVQIEEVCGKHPLLPARQLEAAMDNVIVDLSHGRTVRVEICPVSQPKLIPSHGLLHLCCQGCG